MKMNSKKPKYIALKSKSKKIKALEDEELEDEDRVETLEERELSLVSSQVQELWTIRKKQFLNTEFKYSKDQRDEKEVDKKIIGYEYE